MKYLKKIILKALDKFKYILIKKNSYHSFKTAHNKHLKHMDHLYKKLIKIENPIIFDVGANLGGSIKLFKKQYSKSKIYSFEPVRESFNKIKLQFSENKDINIYNFAVGQKVEKKFLNIYEYGGHSSFFKKIKDTRWEKKNNQSYIKERNKFKLEEKKIEVEMITLDNFCENYKIDYIDFLKIDTQGYEKFVLEGAQNLLKNRKIKIIKLEMIFSEIYEKSASFYDIEGYLHDNYKLISINNFGNTIDDINFSCEVIYVLKNYSF